MLVSDQDDLSYLKRLRNVKFGACRSMRSVREVPSPAVREAVAGLFPRQPSHILFESKCSFIQVLINRSDVFFVFC